MKLFYFIIGFTDIPRKHRIGRQRRGVLNQAQFPSDTKKEKVIEREREGKGKK